jgi:hypothetical protein
MPCRPTQLPDGQITAIDLLEDLQKLLLRQSNLHGKSPQWEEIFTHLFVSFSGSRSVARRDRASDGEVVRHKLTPRLDGLWSGGAMRSRQCDKPLVVCAKHIEQLELPVARQKSSSSHWTWKSTGTVIVDALTSIMYHTRCVMRPHPMVCCRFGGGTLQ